MNLLCRFYDVQKGEILLDGINIKDITKENLRKNIGLVFRYIFVFRLVEDNISLGNKEWV
jgi:ABC-type multidrug transport system fused ATPase/permease subunit